MEAYSKSDVYKAISEARKNGVKRIVLLVDASDPAGALELVRDAMAEATFLTIEVRVKKNV
ncbi:MAG: hypothetical protein ABWK01_04865 [Infirmifilum sp.]